MVMTGADGAAGPDDRPQWRWDVALSFTGAQRPYVEQVASALKARGVRCFYDADEQIDLWGKYLAKELPAIYGEQVVVVFVSAEYAARDWTRAERRASLNRAVRERREYVLPARFDDTPLPGLLSDMVAMNLRTRTPQQFADEIADKLAQLAITASAPSAEAGDPARDVKPAPPTGAVRAGDVDPRRLGVHAAISVPGVPDDVLPEYVPRDIDAAGSGVRAKVAAAAGRGGFVLLVGGSSVGKTSCAAEAVKALLPDWWLVHPAGPDRVAALAQAPSPQTVVWLDELQDYLDGEHGLTGAVVRALLNHLALIIGTLWPDRYTAYTTVPASGAADPHRWEGMKRSLMTDGYGIPLGRVLAATSRHDSPLLAGTLDKLADLGPLPGDIRVHLDAGYDSQVTRDELAARNMTGQIAHKGERAPIQASHRWRVVERTNSWHNAFSRLQRCYERDEMVIEAYFDLADAIITVRSLIRQAWTAYRWDGRPARRP
jgi:TIR domain/Transposase DDE domain